MLNAYLNSPEPHVSIHRDPSCGQIRKRQKPGQRIVQINLETLSHELTNFRDKAHRFGANAEKNDMWLNVEFGDLDFERAVILYVHKLIGQHYTRLGSAKIVDHECL